MRIEALIRPHQGQPALSADVAEIGHFGLTFELDIDPGWVVFGRDVQFRLIVDDYLTPPVYRAAVTRPELHPDDGVRFAARFRRLQPVARTFLEQLMGGVAPPPLPRRMIHVSRPPAPPRPATDERRAHERFDVNARLWLDHGGETHVMRAKNISRGGMMLVATDASAAVVPKGTRVELKLFPALGPPVEISARIVRVLEAWGQVTSYGVQFEGLADKTLIYRMLRRHTRLAELRKTG